MNEIRNAIGQYDGAAITLQNRSARITITAMENSVARLDWALSGDATGVYNTPEKAFKAALRALAKYLEG